MSSDAALKIENAARGVVLPVSARAGARKNGILGVRNGALRVAVTAAPEKGKANRAIIEVLSETLGVAKSAIEILSGETSSQKRILIHGTTAAEVQAALARMLT